MAQACIYALLKMPRTHHCISCKHVFNAGEYEYWKSEPHRYIPGDKYWVTYCAHCKLMDVEKQVVKLTEYIREMEQGMKREIREAMLKEMDKRSMRFVDDMRELRDEMDQKYGSTVYPDITHEQASPWIPHADASTMTDEYGMTRVMR